MTETIRNREDWLIKAATILGEWLEEFGEEVPPLRISVGFPGGRSNRNRTIGQCWSSNAAEDGRNQIYLSPIRGEVDTVNVLGTLLHEMIHAVDDCESGHRGNFLRIAKGMGFVSKFTSSDNRSTELQQRLMDLADRLGPFPHPALLVGARGSEEPKKQTTRQLKAVCSQNPDYKLRLTRKMIEEYGLPYCPCHDEEMIEA